MQKKRLFILSVSILALFVAFLSGFLFAIAVLRLPMQAGAFEDLPPLVGGEGYQTVHLTKQSPLWGGIHYWQDTFDIPSSCSYSILGWDEEARVYYEADCFASSYIYQYDPLSEKQMVIEAPPSLMSDEMEDQAVFGVTENSYKGEEAMPKDISLVSGSGRRSAQHQQIAFVTKWTYSQEQVVLLHKQ